MNASSFDADPIFKDCLSSFIGDVVQCQNYGDYVFPMWQPVNGWFMAEVVLDGTVQNYDDDPALQIVCDGIVVTTIHPKHVQNATTGKHFTYSTYLGVFRGELYDESGVGTNRLFAAISDKNGFGADLKLHFLIKEGNFNT